ncbi:MAG: HAD family hydrolase [Spirochaetota bacterium]
MGKQVRAIFFDMGGTLTLRVEDKKLRRQSMKQLLALLDEKEEPDAFYKSLSERFQAYKRWSSETMIEAPEKEIWTYWILPDQPAEKIEPLIKQLDQLWRKIQGRRVLRPDCRQVLGKLVRRGYCLSVISNTTSPDFVSKVLKEYGLAEYFSSVVLSSIFGRRKPNPEIFFEAVQRAGVEPGQSAYIGDQPGRDIAGPRLAGFALSILIGDNDSSGLEQNDPLLKPDIVIHKLSELLNIFAPLKSADKQGLKNG